MERIELSISDLPADCGGCGVCCLEQSSPPGYILILVQPERRGEWPDQEDIARFESMPTEARKILDEYVKKIQETRPRGETPCVWLDMDTRKCKFYEHRPQICRDLEIGSEGCLRWREEYRSLIKRN